MVGLRAGTGHPQSLALKFTDLAKIWGTRTVQRALHKAGEAIAKRSPSSIEDGFIEWARKMIGIGRLVFH